MFPDASIAIPLIFTLVIALTVHEFAHAWTAYRLGDDTPVRQGRVTLNPLAHLDLFGSIVFVLSGFRFGWGKPVMINPYNFTRRHDELLVAMAGPASNIALAFLTIVAYALLGNSFPELFRYAGHFVSINIVLATFNLLPIPPLDGSSIVAYFWPEYRSLSTSQLGGLLLILLIFMPFPGTNGSLVWTVLQPLRLFFLQVVTLFGNLPLP